MNEKMQHEYFEKIEDYCLGRLLPDARKQFEAAMAIDPQLQEATLAYQRDILPALDHLRRLDLQEKFMRWQEDSNPPEPEPSPSVTNTRTYRWIWWLTGLLLTGALVLKVCQSKAASAPPPSIPPTPNFTDTIATTPSSPIATVDSTIPKINNLLALKKTPARKQLLADLLTQESITYRKERWDINKKIRSGSTDKTTQELDSLIQLGEYPNALRLSQDIKNADERTIRIAFLQLQHGRPESALKAYSEYKNLTGESDEWLEVLIYLSMYRKQEASPNSQNDAKAVFWKKLDQFSKTNPQQARKLAEKLAAIGLSKPLK
jgi:hypothetical protein